MIEDLVSHKSSKFTVGEAIADKASRSPFFNNLKEISGPIKSDNLSKLL